MKIIVVTPVRMLGDGLAACLNDRRDIAVIAIVNNLADLRQRLADSEIHAVLMDVTQGVDLWDVRAIAAEWPQVALIAIGLKEQRQEVIDCGRAGYSGYVSREASLDELSQTLHEIVAGRQECPPEITSGLLRALFRSDPYKVEFDREQELTRRESEVLELLGGGFSNKEIADKLCLSVATVKHHVHHVLEKLNLERRAQAMRRVREAPWLGRAVTGGPR